MQGIRKSTIAIVIAFIMCVTLVGCANVESTEENENKQLQQTTSLETTTTSTTNSTTKSETTTTTSIETTTTTIAEPTVSYMSDMQVVYQEAAHVYLVFWSFADQDHNPMAAEADVTISIKNDDSEVVYDQTTQVTKFNFSDWSNTLPDNKANSLLGCIGIPDDEITPGTSKQGTLTISAKGESFSLDEQIFNVYDLPIKKSSIAVPDIPLQVSTFTWSGEIDTTLEITDIQTLYEDTEIIMKFKCTLVYNKDGDQEAQACRFGYRLKDKDGIIVDSGTIYTNALKLGDTTYAEEIFYDFLLDFSQDYELELWNDK